MRRLLLGLARWSERDEIDWGGPIDASLVVLVPVALVTGSAGLYATISVLALLGILDRAWRLGA